MTLVTLTHQETKEKHEFSLTGSPTPSFEKLVDTISSLMGLDPPFKVKYMDEENELVTISSDIELATALESPTLSLVIIGGKRTPTKSTLDYALPVSREAREAESFVRSRQEAHIPIPIPDFLPEDLESAPASPLDTIPPAPAQAEPGTPSSHAHPHRQLELPEPETEPESEPQAAQNSAQELARQKHIITSLILKAFLGIKDETLADNEQDLLRYAGAVYGLASALIPPGPSHSIVAQEVVSGLEACGYRVDSPSQAQLLEAFSSAKANDSLPSGSITGAWRFTETESTVFINPTPRKAPPVVSSEEEEQPTTRSADEQVEVGALAAVPEPQQAPKSEDDFVLVSDEEQDQPTAKAEQEQQEHEERQKEEEEQKQKQKQEEEQEEEEQRQKKEEEQRQKKEEEERQKKEEEERQKEEEERQREEEKRQREEEQRQKKRQQEEEEKRQQEEEKRQQEEDERQREKKEEEERQKEEEEERQKKEEEERQKEEEERQREEQRQKKRQQEEEKRQQEEEKRQQEEDERQREEEEEKKRQEEEDERQRDEEDSDGELLKKNSDQELFEKVKEFDPYANRDRDLDLEPIADLEMDSVEDVSFSGDNKPQWARTFPEDQSEGESDDNDSFQNAMSTLQPQQPQPPFEDPRAFHGYPHRDHDHDHDLYHDHNNGAYHDPYPQVFAQHHQRQDHGHHAQPQAPAHAEPPQQLDEADQVAQLTDMGFTDMDLIFDAIKKFPTYEERVNFLLERSSRT